MTNHSDMNEIGTPPLEPPEMPPLVPPQGPTNPPAEVPSTPPIVETVGVFIQTVS